MQQTAGAIGAALVQDVVERIQTLSRFQNFQSVGLSLRHVSTSPGCGCGTFNHSKSRGNLLARRSWWELCLSEAIAHRFGSKHHPNVVALFKSGPVDQQ